MSRWHDDALVYRDLIETMLRFPKPLIATVQGPAVAGGLGLVLACDFVLAGPRAIFGLPEVRRGLVAGIVAPLLTFRIGAGLAARLLLGGETIDAAEAHRIHMAHELVDESQLAARGRQLADDCAKSAPEALLMTKRLLNEIIGENLMTQLAAGAAVSATARTTEAAAEGLEAYASKREPKWL